MRGGGAEGDPSGKSGMAQISIAAFGSYLPGNEVGLGFFRSDGEGASQRAESPMMAPPVARRHVSPDERAAEMIEKAARPMFDRLGIDPSRELDIILTNVLLPDYGITGSGAEAAERLGSAPDWVIDLHNGGCASFAYMLKIASAIIRSEQARSALICNVQNCAGQLYAQSEIRTRAHAAGPGDGCGVAYVTTDGASTVLGVEVRHHPEFAQVMGLAAPEGRKYWQPGIGQVDVKFDRERVADVVNHGNHVVPEVVTGLCRQLGISIEEIDFLVTNQPNRMFLRNWRQALGVPAERHLDTFDRFGNLFGAGVPVTLHHAIQAGTVGDGHLVVFAGFAHAGDFAAAAALRWQSS
jgi:3-oxoacyl-[acyl-carrier-protein] synthase-3